MEKSLEIKAPRPKLWDVLLNFNSWPSPLGPNTSIETDWLLNGDIHFIDLEGNGLAGKILTYRTEEIISIKYLALLRNGREDISSNEAREWIGAREVWQLDQHARSCFLTIEKDIPPRLIKDMSLKWDEALYRISDMAEKK